MSSSFSLRVAARRTAQLRKRAAGMRRSLTPSEAALWQALRGRQLGVAFRRQVVIGSSFIADFAAPQARLVVEVDGGYHTERRVADARRDRKLRRLGWRVVRLEARLVAERLPEVFRYFPHEKIDGVGQRCSAKSSETRGRCSNYHPQAGTKN